MDKTETNDASSTENLNCDCRVSCTSSANLERILETVDKHVSDLADSCHLGEETQAFKNRFRGMFRNAIQENTAVRGLPWVPDKYNLTTAQREEHHQNVDDAILQRLSGAVTEVARKRKNYPQNCCGILSMVYKHERENLKNFRPKFTLDPLPAPSSKLWPSTIEKFRKMAEHLKHLNTRVPISIEETKQKQEAVKHFRDVNKRQKLLVEPLSKENTLTNESELRDSKQSELT